MGLSETLFSILVILFYCYLLLFPFIGIVQLLLGITYLLDWKNKPLEFRKAIKKYWIMVLLFAIYPCYIYATDIAFPEVFGLIYMVGTPSLIAIYFVRITREQYPEELEKLIF